MASDDMSMHGDELPVTSSTIPIHGVDADILMVSQIGGLRARSAIAQATTSQLNAAIAERRGRHEQELARRRSQRTHRVDAVLRRLVPLSSVMSACWDVWRDVANRALRRRCLAAEAAAVAALESSAALSALCTTSEGNRAHARSSHSAKLERTWDVVALKANRAVVATAWAAWRLLASRSHTHRGALDGQVKLSCRYPPGRWLAATTLRAWGIAILQERSQTHLRQRSLLGSESATRVLLRASVALWKYCAQQTTTVANKRDVLQDKLRQCWIAWRSFVSGTVGSRREIQQQFDMAMSSTREAHRRALRSVMNSAVRMELFSRCAIMIWAWHAVSLQHSCAVTVIDTAGDILRLSDRSRESRCFLCGHVAAAWRIWRLSVTRAREHKWHEEASEALSLQLLAQEADAQKAANSLAAARCAVVAAWEAGHKATALRRTFWALARNAAPSTTCSSQEQASRQAQAHSARQLARCCISCWRSACGESRRAWLRSRGCCSLGEVFAGFFLTFQQGRLATMCWGCWRYACAVQAVESAKEKLAEVSKQLEEETRCRQTIHKKFSATHCERSIGPRSPTKANSINVNVQEGEFFDACQAPNKKEVAVHADDKENSFAELDVLCEQENIPPKQQSQKVVDLFKLAEGAHESTDALSAVDVDRGYHQPLGGNLGHVGDASHNSADRGMKALHKKVQQQEKHLLQLQSEVQSLRTQQVQQQELELQMARLRADMNAISSKQNHQRHDLDVMRGELSSVREGEAGNPHSKAGEGGWADAAVPLCMTADTPRGSTDSPRSNGGESGLDVLLGALLGCSPAKAQSVAQGHDEVAPEAGRGVGTPQANRQPLARLRNCPNTPPSAGNQGTLIGGGRRKVTFHLDGDSAGGSPCAGASKRFALSPAMPPAAPGDENTRQLEEFMRAWILDTIHSTFPSVDNLSSVVAPAEMVELFQQLCSNGSLPMQTFTAHLTPRSMHRRQSAAVERAVYQAWNSLCPNKILSCADEQKDACSATQLSKVNQSAENQDLGPPKNTEFFTICSARGLVEQAVGGNAPNPIPRMQDVEEADSSDTDDSTDEDMPSFEVTGQLTEKGTAPNTEHRAQLPRLPLPELDN